MPTAGLLPDGKVLVVGGGTTVGGNTLVIGSSELFDPDPQKEKWSLAGDLNTPRINHTQTLLVQRRQHLRQEFEVLIAGGIDASGGSGNVLSSAEVFRSECRWIGVGSNF